MKFAPCSPIGLIDSGMGGISIWTELVRTMPRERIIYWADSAHCPYGGRGQAEITELVRVGVRALLAHQVKIIVIACNTATTAAIATLRAEWPEVLFVGLEPAVKPAARATRSGVIGILGTAYTIQSDMFRRTTAKYAGDIRVIATAGDGLVQQIENGLDNSPETETLLRRYIGPMIAAGADNLVLACTHYPLLTTQIQRIITEAGSDMEIINPAPAIARHTFELLRERNMHANRNDQTDQTDAMPNIEEESYIFLSTGTETDIQRLRARARQYRMSFPEAREKAFSEKTLLEKTGKKASEKVRE